MNGVRLFGDWRDDEDVVENTPKLQENTRKIRGKCATGRMLGTHHGKACRINVVTVEENVTATRGNGRKHG